MEDFRVFFIQVLYDIANTDAEIALFFLISIAGVMVLDSISVFTRRKKRTTGIEARDSKQLVSNVTSISPKKYVSHAQGIAGTPDALIIEDGFVIPLERKPMARKIRDRYVAQLLVYMRLVEEFEGKKPPYGYLILGKNCRRVRIYNTPKRQKWLQDILDEMRDILNERSVAKPSPFPAKCHRCSMRSHCAHFSADQHADVAVAEARKSLRIINE